MYQTNTHLSYLLQKKKTEIFFHPFLCRITPFFDTFITTTLSLTSKAYCRLYNITVYMFLLFIYIKERNIIREREERVPY
jgi:hypothetical protein